MSGIERRLCVLIVEDDANSLSAMARLLEQGGYSVRRAATYHQALELAPGCDVLLADIGLPDGSGLDLLRELAGAAPGLRGVAVSGFGETADLTRATRAGFSEYLVKPVVLDDVLAAIERACALHKPANGNGSGVVHPS
jgi:two-component system, chemotaxis family, CheB/CheR fusion protein